MTVLEVKLKINALKKRQKDILQIFIPVLPIIIKR